MKKAILFASVVLLAVVLSGCGKATSTANTNAAAVNTTLLNTVVSNAATTNSAVGTINADSANANATGEFPIGSVQVEGESGALTNEGSYSYVGTSARGGEAYLGDGGATVTYSVPVIKAGTYVMSVRLSDDALHQNGARNATISVNGTAVLRYTHISEDTKGWKWYSLGNISLKKGSNTIAIEKDASTSAAFVMDAFKVVPAQTE
ncbi:MAG: CBM35 domain-containing protein [Patescibacteria group bacterium]|nr:CBM35 domain-containing protein [Patescibacteria group bacterium]MDD5716021.1 CBM35 domain-containing protein [Patescibacteria group bacterium]